MKIFLENPNLLIKEFNEFVSVSQNKTFITIGIEIQKQEIETIKNYREELNQLKKDFVQRNLENEANLIYCISHSILAIQYELQMLVDIKEDRMDDAWSNLVNAQVIYGTVIRNSSFGFESSDSYLHRLANYEKLLFPNLYFHSVGGIIKKSHCSICNQSFNQCDHIKGKLYNGELCTRIVTKMQLEEISLVENPANKHCRVTTIQSNGKTVDIMTLREKDTF